MNRLGILAFPACVFNCQAKLEMESLPGDGVWVDPRFKKTNPENRIRATAWFEKQFPGDGAGFLRRAREFAVMGRTKLRSEVLTTLKAASESSRRSFKGTTQRPRQGRDLLRIPYPEPCKGNGVRGAGKSVPTLLLQEEWFPHSGARVSDRAIRAV